MSKRRTPTLMQSGPLTRAVAVTLGLPLLQACGDDGTLDWPADTADTTPSTASESSTTQSGESTTTTQSDESTTTSVSSSDGASRDAGSSGESTSSSTESTSVTVTSESDSNGGSSIAPTDGGADGGVAPPTCADVTCEHGTCIDEDAGAVCECEADWSGPLCNIATPRCDSQSCNATHGGGTCDDSQGNITCTCNAPYDGANCDQCAADYQDNDGDGVCTVQCSADTCNQHGACNDSSGTAVCSCDTQYAGPTCDSCAAQYQDNDGNRSCLPVCVEETCSGHGVCDDSSGSATCACSEGYAGPTCSTCATNYQDFDGDLECTAGCSITACVNGVCDESGGTAQCTCEIGYAGSDCSVCDVGYQDFDGNLECNPACGPFTCNNNGTCSDFSGLASCTCDIGYGGTDCSGCDNGYQDNDGNGSCMTACTPSTCNGNGTCDDAVGPAVCTCAPHFAGADCGACDVGYTGVVCEVCDAGFQDNDNNGSCAPSCEAATCNNHGSCDDASGSPLCTCSSEYTGGDCSACAAGYQDNDNNGSCTAACTPSDCNAESGHGTCSDSSGTRTCACTSPWDGVDCNSCATGFQDNDGNGTCTPACTDLTCNAGGGGGSCSDSTGAVVCTCNPEFLGDSCDIELSQWTLVYDLSIPNSANWDNAAQVNAAYTTDNSNAPGAFTRVAYLLTLDGTYVWTAMDSFTSSKSLLGIPVDWSSGQPTSPFPAAVANLDVASNAPNVVDISGASDGKLEFWANAYAASPDSAFNHNDTPNTADAYGSLQVHRTTVPTTIFAYNGWSRNAPTPNSDLGIGLRTTGQSDWTLAANAASYTNKRLKVYVK